MKLLAVIGNPIGHSLSPVLYNTAFLAMDIDGHYEAWQVLPDDLGGIIDRLRQGDMMGMNVTVPHKQAVMALLDEVDGPATAIGAVNCISKDGDRLIGHNTDKYGFIRSLREGGCRPEGLHALVLGVGGSARAVAYGLAESGVASIALAGRTQAHVQELAVQLQATAPGAIPIQQLGWGDVELTSAAAEADLVVNCTPIGMLHTENEASSPLPEGALRAGMYVCDLVYNPAETPLLAQASAAGATAIGGLEMLIYQAAESVRLWTDREAPVDIMRRTVRATLGQGS